MSKIGFVGNFYGTPKGHSYVIRDLIKILREEKHETHMFRARMNELLPEFIEPDTMKSYQGSIIPKEDFEKWLDEVKPEYCVFMEYCQWWEEDHDKLQICKDRGIKTYGFLVWEKLNWDKLEHYKLYTKILSPTGFQTKLMRQKGLYNSVHTPWGVFMDEIDKIKEPPRKDKVVFYHCAGSGGVGDRKNTLKVIEAYDMIKDDTTELFITHLGKNVFTKDQIIGFTKYADVLLNPSKWDTIGLNNIEANACGRPVITTDAPPMNELIQDNVNGLLVKAIEGKCEHVTCPSMDLDVDDLAKKMELCKNKEILKVLQGNSRVFAETNFDWKNNKGKIIKLFEGEK